MKKKVLFFHFDLGGGGAENVLVNLLNNLDKTKYDITLHTIFGVGVNLSRLDKSIKFRCVFRHVFRGMTSIMKLFPPKLLYRIIVRKKYDIIIAYLENSPTRILSGCPYKDTKKIAWVHTQVDDIKRFISPYRSLNEAVKCYASFDKIVFVSRSSEEIFKNTMKISIPTETIYNTLEVDTIKLKSQEEINIMLSKDIINICSVGRFVKVKGFERLFKVFARLKNEGYSNFHFYLLGTGGLETIYRNIVSECNLDGYITFLGFQNNPYKYVAKMDLFVCSSYKEGFSTAVTESVIVGTPVLTTDCSGMSEILDGGKVGFIVENSEEGLYLGLKRILEDASILQTYRRLIKDRYLLFSKEQTVLSVENLLDTI